MPTEDHQPVYYPQDVPPQTSLYPQEVTPEDNMYAKVAYMPQQQVQYAQVPPQMFVQYPSQQFVDPNIPVQQAIYVLPTQPSVLPDTRLVRVGKGVQVVSIITLVCAIIYTLFALMYSMSKNPYFVFETILGIFLIVISSIGIASARHKLILRQVKFNSITLAGCIIFLSCKILAAIIVPNLKSHFEHGFGTAVTFALASLLCAIPVIGTLLGLTAARVRFFKMENAALVPQQMNEVAVQASNGIYPTIMDQQQQQQQQNV
jgi:hypothetical protein